ncbi:MAG: flagellar biosynthetic protein FliQ [Rhizobiaceae bacterium]
MNQADALELMQASVWTVLTTSAPAIIAAMLVGVGIALLQALTQVQEVTLTFVPKILAILLAVSISAPFMGTQIGYLATIAFSRIEAGF